MQRVSLWRITQPYSTAFDEGAQAVNRRCPTCCRRGRELGWVSAVRQRSASAQDCDSTHRWAARIHRRTIVSIGPRTVSAGVPQRRVTTEALAAGAWLVRRLQERAAQQHQREGDPRTHETGIQDRPLPATVGPRPRLAVFRGVCGGG